MLEHARISSSNCSQTRSILLNLPFDKKYRGHFEIITLILEAAKYNSATKFEIMKQASVNCNQLKKYLQILTKIGLIEIDVKERNCLYRTSKKGLDFLRQFYILLEMLLEGSSFGKTSNITYEAEYNIATSLLKPKPQLAPHQTAILKR